MEYSIEIISFFFLEKKKKNIDFLVGFCRKMTSQSNNVGVPESSQVATPTMAQVAIPTVVAQAPMVHTSEHVSVSLGEQPEKFNGLKFKR